MRSFFIMIICLNLCGCATYGPEVVRKERTNYNRVVHDTTAEQLLLNLVRASDHESPSFCNFTGVDASPAVGASISGGPTNIGALLPLGVIAGTLSASEVSIQKLACVSGSELIAQISKPIGLQNIFRLGSSNASVFPLLEFSINQFGSGYSDYYRILNILDILDLYGALVYEARNENTLTVTLSSRGILGKPDRFIRDDDPLGCIKPVSPLKFVEDEWADLVSMLPVGKSGSIVLRSSDARPHDSKAAELDVADMKLPGTVVLTRTAVGALGLTDDGHDILFRTPAEAQKIRDLNKTNNVCFTGEFYFNREHGNLNDLPNTEDSIQTEWKDYLRFGLLKATPELKRFLARHIGHDVTLIIVETSAEAPIGSYVSIEKDGKWYSINELDTVSKKNFSLLNTLVTIQSAPQAKAETQTSLNVR